MLPIVHQSTIDISDAVFMQGINPIQEVLDSGDSVAGFNEASRRRNRDYQIRLSEAANLWQRFMEGRISPNILREAFNPSSDYTFNELHRLAPHVFHESMSTSDFGSLTADVMRATLAANYAALPATYPTLARVNRTIVDFRLLKRYYTDGGESHWEQAKEGAPYTRKTFSEAYLSYSVKKYRAGFGLTWESIISDVLGIFQDVLGRVAQGGRDTIEHFVTTLYCDANGPHSSFYTNDNENIIKEGSTPNPALTQSALTAALGQMWDRKTEDGRPISIPMLYLVVGSGDMYARALNLKNALFGDVSSAPGASTNVLRIPNWQSSRFEIVFNPFIANVAPTAAKTSWWMFASPNVGRPALEVGFLRGFDTPQMFRKAPNAQRVGGGLAAEIGDFDTMSHEFMGVLVFGGTRLFPWATMASNGTGQ